MDTQTEISHNWKNHFEGKIATREELYREEVNSTLNYLRLRKIKRLIIENQLELEKTNNPDDQLLYMETHLALKALETKLTSESGMVIYK
jgi:DNA primase